jgi:hypothetical protein
MRIENWELRIGQIDLINSQFPILNSHPRERDLYAAGLAAIRFARRDL